ncbi:MAG: hypothetical protein ABEJ25_03495 [Candidatus Bipolaricaulia bacterium]
MHERQKFRSLFLATLTDEIAKMEDAQLNTHMSETVWHLLDLLEEAEWYQFIGLIRALEQASFEARKETGLPYDEPETSGRSFRQALGLED